MRIQIQTTNDRFPTDVDGEQTVLALKEQLQSRCNLAPNEMRLVYAGRILQDEMTLNAYRAFLDEF